MQNYITKGSFNGLSENLIKYTIPREFVSSISYKDLSLRLFQHENIISYDVILERANRRESPVVVMFVKKVILVDYALMAFDSKVKLNTLFVWRLVFETIRFFRKNNPVGTIGSQGFLPIELYRFESNKDRKILRLHIWDDRFGSNFEANEYRKYKVHSHRYYAQSHVLCGCILNKRFEIVNSEKDTDLSLYSIEYKTIDNDDGVAKRESYLEVERDNIIVQNLSNEVISINQNYEINVNEFHSSHSSLPISATLFLFNSDKGSVNNSKVVGPPNDSDPGFKYEKVNILSSLYEIDRELNGHYNKQVLLSLDWMRKIHILEHAHRIESRQLKMFSELLSWSIVLIPASISALAIYSNLIEDKQTSIYILAILAGLGTLLGTINKVVKPSDVGERHRVNSEKFEHLRHKIEQYIVFNNDERLESLLENVRNDWEKLTLHNVKEYNFKKARNMVRGLNKYPENLGFIN